MTKRVRVVVTRTEYPACWTWPLPPKEWDRPKNGWLAINAWQRGMCAICGRHKSEFVKRSWHQDHDHESGELRGWLCRSCNVMEGNAGPDVQPFARYRLINPGTILEVVEPYVNPYTGEPSIPWPE